MIETPIRCEIFHPGIDLPCTLCGERVSRLMVAVPPPGYGSVESLIMCIPCAEGLARCIVASVAGEGPDG